jgi:hypothetical protein
MLAFASWAMRPKMDCFMVLPFVLLSGSH